MLLFLCSMVLYVQDSVGLCDEQIDTALDAVSTNDPLCLHPIVEFITFPSIVIHWQLKFHNQLMLTLLTILVLCSSNAWMVLVC